MRTLGFEAQGFSPNSSEYARYFEGFITGTVTSATSPVHTAGGTPAGRSMKCDSGAGNAAAHSLIYVDPSVTDGGAWARCYFYFETNMPSASSTTLMTHYESNGTGPLVSARLTSGGKLQLWNETGTPAQIGSDSSATLVANTWYRIELKCLILTASTDTVELQLDGVSVASASGLTLGSVDTNYIRIGFVTAPGASRVCYLDDFADNDNVGADQNAFPGAGNIVLLLPISDNQVGSWTGGAGGTTNLWEAINNTPPIGTDSETDSTQIENAVSGGGTNYIANMTSYTTAGIVAGDTIKVVYGFVDTGEDSGAGSKLGSCGIASNPNLGQGGLFTFGNIIGSGALGVWPINWGVNPNAGSVGYNPSVTLGTSPTFEIDRFTTTTTVASIDFAGIYVEYVPATFSASFMAAIDQQRLGIAHTQPAALASGMSPPNFMPN
jgi:hypothetical protein